MKNYKVNSIMRVIELIFSIIFVILVISKITDSNLDILSKTFAIGVILIALISIIILMKSEKSNIVNINNSSVHIVLRKLTQDNECLFRFDEIKKIKRVAKFSPIYKTIEIASWDKSITIEIGKYTGYKEFLNILVENTKNNKSIYIDKKLYKWIGNNNAE